MNKNTLQSGISITLMLIGISFVLGAALFGARYVLSASLMSDPTYLESTIVPTFGVPSGLMEPGPASMASQTSSTPAQEQAGNNLASPLLHSADQETSPEVMAFPMAGSPSMDESPLDVANLLPTEPSQAGMAPMEDGAQAVDESGSQPQPEVVEESASEQEGTPAPPQPTPETGADTPPESESQPQQTETVINSEDQPEQEQEQGPPPETQPNPDEPETTEGGQDGNEGAPSEDATAPPARPEPQPAVRLRIPKLRVERAIVPTGWTRKGWNTDPLFATRNRPDLVGHLEGSAFPGEGGNIVLVGHNFDWGIYQWYGVFSNLKSLSLGDKIKLYTKDGEEHIYFVEKVKMIPYSNGKNDMSRHYKFIGLKNKEMLTLVTCGGANFWFWNKRVYVVALPAE